MKTKKALIIIWLCALTLYAPIELTRLIFVYGLEPDTIAELCLIWLFYLLAIGTLTRVVRV